MTFLTGCNEGRKLRHFRAKPYFKRMVFLKKDPARYLLYLQYVEQKNKMPDSERLRDSLQKCLV